jgi:hypothetical protein
MRYLFLCVLAVVAACTAVQSVAQPVDAGGILTLVEGHVRVNEGKMYVTAYSGMPITLKARILVLNKAKAVVRHADGCVTELGANTLFVLNRQSPCHGGVAGIRMIKPVNVAMPESAGVAATGGFLGGLSVPVVAGVGAVVVGGTVAGIVAGTSGGGGPSQEELQFLLRRKPLSGD